jgi:hypothetical protein
MQSFLRALGSKQNCYSINTVFIPIASPYFGVFGNDDMALPKRSAEVRKWLKSARMAEISRIGTRNFLMPWEFQ